MSMNLSKLVAEMNAAKVNAFTAKNGRTTVIARDGEKSYFLQSTPVANEKGEMLLDAEGKQVYVWTVGRELTPLNA